MSHSTTRPVIFGRDSNTARTKLFDELFACQKSRTFYQNSPMYTPSKKPCILSKAPMFGGWCAHQVVLGHTTEPNRVSEEPQLRKDLRATYDRFKGNF